MLLYYITGKEEILIEYNLVDSKPVDSFLVPVLFRDPQKGAS